MCHTAASIPVTAMSAPAFETKYNAATPDLEDFIDMVINGRATEVVGIYIPGVLALPVGQQPKGKSSYVTRETGRATQFNLAGQYGTVGILAHNDLAGAEFSNIQVNQYTIIVYGNGRLDYYLVDHIEKYQALSPTSTFSDFVNLDGSNELLTANQLFKQVYGPGERLVLQTCIEANGDPSWGRMFIIAEPATVQVKSVVKDTSFLLQFASFGMAYR